MAEAVTSVKVAVRVRPLTPAEAHEGACEGVQVQPETSTIILGSGSSEKKFGFDHLFPSCTTSSELYRTCVYPLLQRAIQGYHATIFAYGQTGSGKTFTMMEGYGNAAVYAERPGEAAARTSNEFGVAPQLMRDLFYELQTAQSSGRDAGAGRLTSFRVKASCLEIYNEQVFDLLSEAGATSAKNVVIRDNDAGEQVVTGLTEVAVNTAPDMASVLARGMAARSTASTNMNARSSRSHAIFTITIEQNLEQAGSADDAAPLVIKRRSQIHVVDLAGSERAKKTGAEGDRLREASSINRGLLALGNVINALASMEDAAADGAAKASGQPPHVPYRDSKLTRLLKSSLGGNAHTLMIACCSPADVNLEETLSTLRYASRARSIKNKAAVNVDPTTAQLLALREQVRQLQAALASVASGAAVSELVGGQHVGRCACGADVCIPCSGASALLASGSASGASGCKAPMDGNDGRDVCALDADAPGSSAANMAQLMQRLGNLDARNRTAQVEAARAQREINRMTEEYTALAEMLCNTEQQRDAVSWRLQQLVSACKLALDKSASSPTPSAADVLSDVRIALEAVEAAEAHADDAGDMDIDFDDVNLDGLEAPPSALGTSADKRSTDASRGAASTGAAAMATAAASHAPERSMIPVSTAVAFRKATLAREFGAISSALREKEALLSAHSRNQQMLESAQRMHEDELTTLKNELNALRTERQRLESMVTAPATEATRTSSSANVPAGTHGATLDAVDADEALRIQIRKKDEQIHGLQTRIRDAARQLALKQKSDLQLAALEAEVAQMREMKVALQKRMKDESDRSRMKEKEAAAALAQANRLATKTAIENQKLVEMTKQQQAVIRRKMEEIAAMQRKQREQTDRVAKTGGVYHASASAADDVQKMLARRAGDVLGTGASTIDAGDASLQADSEATFSTVATARAGLAVAAGKMSNLADAITAAYRSGSSRDLLAGASKRGGMPSALQRADGDNDDDEDDGVEASTALDGLVALADCFANTHASKVPLALRRLLEGDMSCRVTLRRARALVGKLTDERRALMRQIEEAQERGQGDDDGEDSVALQDLQQQVDVINNDLAALNDTIISLRSQLEAQGSTGTTTSGARATRAKTGHWTAELTTVSAGKSAVAWLATTIIALADTCDNAVRHMASVQQASASTTSKLQADINKYKDAVRRAEQRASEALRNREEELFFLTRKVAEVVATRTNPEKGMPSEQEVIAALADESTTAGPSIDDMTRIISLQSAQLESASNFMSRAREAEDAADSLRASLDTAMQENATLKQQLEDALQRESSVRFAAAALSLAQERGSKRRSGGVGHVEPATDGAGVELPVQIEEVHEDASAEAVAFVEDDALVDSEQSEDDELPDDDAENDDDDYVGSDGDAPARSGKRRNAKVAPKPARQRRGASATVVSEGQDAPSDADEATEKAKRKKKRMAPGAAAMGPNGEPLDACGCGSRSKCMKCACTKAGRKCGESCGCSAKTCANRVATSEMPASADAGPKEAPSRMVLDIDPTEAAGLHMRGAAAGPAPEMPQQPAAAGTKRGRTALSTVGPVQPNVPPPVLPTGKPPATLVATVDIQNAPSAPPQRSTVPAIEAEGASSLLAAGNKPIVGSGPRASVISARALDRLAMPKSVVHPKPLATSAPPAPVGRVSLSKTSSILSRPPVTATQRAVVRPPAVPGVAGGLTGTIVPASAGDATAAPQASTAATSARIVSSTHPLSQVR